MCLCMYECMYVRIFLPLHKYGSYLNKHISNPISNCNELSQTTRSEKEQLFN